MTTFGPGTVRVLALFCECERFLREEGEHRDGEGDTGKQIVRFPKFLLNPSKVSSKGFYPQPCSRIASAENSLLTLIIKRRGIRSKIQDE